MPPSYSASVTTLTFLAIQPAPPLRDAIETIWLYENTDFEHSFERVVATGSMQLLVNLESDELRWHNKSTSGSHHSIRGAVLSGAATQPVEIDTLQQRSITGVSFRPGGSAAFFTGNLGELQNDNVDLADYPVFNSLRDQLLEARQQSAEAVLQCWQERLCACFRGYAFPQVAMAALLLRTAVSVTDTAATLSLPVRRLREEFLAVTGVLPKTYARIERIQRLIREVAVDIDASHHWATLACTHGFTDQAHMIHDFRQFVGCTPGQYRPRSQKAFNHLVLY